MPPSGKPPFAISQSRPRQSAGFMHWKKLGRVFVPRGESWMHAYAQVPTPFAFDDFIRVYFGCRPKNPPDPLPVSQIGYVDLDRKDPSRVLRLAEGPVLSLGGRGCFDEFGLHPLSAIRKGDEIRLYYVGWT